MGRSRQLIHWRCGAAHWICRHIPGSIPRKGPADDHRLVVNQKYVRLGGRMQYRLQQRAQLYPARIGRGHIAFRQVTTTPKEVINLAADNLTLMIGQRIERRRRLIGIALGVPVNPVANPINHRFSEDSRRFRP